MAGWRNSEAIPIFRMIQRNECLPLLFVTKGRPLSACVQANIATSHGENYIFKRPHAFECFGPSQDELVDELARYLRKVADARGARGSIAP